MALDLNNKEFNDIKNMRIFLKTKFKEKGFLGLSFQKDYRYINDLYKKYPNNPSAIISSAYLDWRFGDKEIAEQKFCDANKLAIERNYQLEWFEIGVRSFLEKPHLNDFRIDDECNSSFQFNYYASDNKKPIILTCCDEVYFNKFGISFINICLKHYDGVVHVHVINPSYRTLNFFKRRKSERISFSIEENLIDLDRAYYASSRFMISQKIIKEYGADILMVDIDQAISRDITKIINSFSSNKHNLYINKLNNSWMPWNYYLAGNIYLRNNDLTLDLLNAIINYIHNVVKINNSYKNLWFLDQNALTYAVNTFQKISPIKIARANLYGQIAIGPMGLSKDKFSKLLSLYNKSINFDCKVIDKTNASKDIAVLIENKGLSHMYIDGI
jgi:hypothetical protein